MSSQMDRIALVNELNEQGDPQGVLRPEIYRRFSKTLKARIESRKRRYPALRNVSATSIYHSLFMRLRKGFSSTPVEGTGLLVRMAFWLVNDRNDQMLAQRRDVRREDSSDAARDGLAAPTPTPYEDARIREELAAAGRLLQAMSAEDRQMLALYVNEGKTFREIGELLGIEEDAARKRFYAAKGRLEEKMKAEGLLDG